MLDTTLSQATAFLIDCDLVALFLPAFSRIGRRTIYRTSPNKGPNPRLVKQK